MSITGPRQYEIAASASPATMNAICAQTRIRFLSIRSARSPAGSARMTTGRAVANPISPRARAEPVRS